MLFVDVIVYSIGSMDTMAYPDIHVIHVVAVVAVIKPSHFVACDTTDSMLHVFAYSDVQHILRCFSSSCVPYSAICSALSIFDYPFGTL